MPISRHNRSELSDDWEFQSPVPRKLGAPSTLSVIGNGHRDRRHPPNALWGVMYRVPFICAWWDLGHPPG